MRYRLISFVLVIVLLVCSACSSGLTLPETAEPVSTAVLTAAYDGPGPSVFAINPSGTWDTVSEEVRSYIRTAHEQYVPGDTSFTVQNETDLWSKSVPVVFSWEITNDEADGFSDPVLEISEDPGFLSCISVSLNQRDLRNGVYSKSVDNLKTGTTYYWRISMTASGGCKTVSEVFSFQTATGPRLLKIDGVKNARDIGGWDTMDGKTVRQGLVYRSARLDDANGTGQRTIKEELRIKTELDLRNPDNPDDAPLDSPFQYSLNYINISSKSYSYFDQPEKNARILRIFAKPANYPIIFHCTGGADRTGAWAFMIKALCGVDEIDLICDYELTSNRFRSGYVSGSFNADFPKLYKTLLGLPGNTVRDKIYNYYHDQCGMNEMELANVVTMLTTDSAVFTDPTKGLVLSNDGTVSALITLRSTDGIASVIDEDGRELAFSFDKGIIKVTPVDAGAGSAKVNFSDGSALPLIWTAA